MNNHCPNPSCPTYAMILAMLQKHDPNALVAIGYADGQAVVVARCSECGKAKEAAKQDNQA